MFCPVQDLRAYTEYSKRSYCKWGTKFLVVLIWINIYLNSHVVGTTFSGRRPQVKFGDQWACWSGLSKWFLIESSQKSGRPQTPVTCLVGNPVHHHLFCLPTYSSARRLFNIIKLNCPLTLFINSFIHSFIHHFSFSLPKPRFSKHTRKTPEDMTQLSFE